MSKKLFHIGRAPDNDIILDDLSISKKHIQLSEEEGVIYVRDVGSSNGTFINKKRLPLYEKTALKEKDILKLGDLVLPWEKCFVEESTSTESEVEENEEEIPPPQEQEEKAEAVPYKDPSKFIPTPIPDPPKQETTEEQDTPKKSLKDSIIQHKRKVSLIEKYGIYALLIVTFLSLMLWYFTQVTRP